MAHQIAELGEGVHAFASARQHAWHRLGTVLDEEMTAEEALEAAHLARWNVRKIKISGRDVAVSSGGTGPVRVAIPDRFATVFTNPVTGLAQYLGVVGTHFDPFQNEWTTDFLNALSHQAGAHFETAGAIFDGRQVFVSCKLPDGMQVGGRDLIEWYLLARNYHDGNGSFEAHVVPIRPVCANTITAGIRGAAASVKIRHTKGSKAAAVQEAQRVLGLTFKYEEAFQAEAEALIAKQIDDDTFFQIVGDLFAGGKPESERTVRQNNLVAGHVESVEPIWRGATGTMDGVTGTAWGGYQAFTEYTDHFQPIRVGDDFDVARARRVVTSQEGLKIKTDAWKAFAAA